MATGCLSMPRMPDFPGLDELQGRDLPHRPLAARGRRLHRPARRRDRHRLVGHPVDPVIAEQASHLTVFQRTPNFSDPGAQRAARREDVQRSEGELSGDPAQRARGGAHRHRCRRCRDRGALDVATTSAAPVRGALGAGRPRLHGASTTTCCSTRRPTTPPPSSSRDKIREIVKDPADRRSCCARTTTRSARKRLCVDTGYYETFNRPNVDAGRRAEPTPIEAITAERRARQAARSTRSTPSCSPPASTR